jgi:hypothetical protein
MLLLVLFFLSILLLTQLLILFLAHFPQFFFRSLHPTLTAGGILQFIYVYLERCQGQHQELRNSVEDQSSL